ncbi:MAG: hypothetical protein Q4C60_11755, partial [Eubacteriales bacterium]|nr:hypothetical protein [Eubacteriales bacterium]
SAASRLPLLMIGRSLSRKQAAQIRASTICSAYSRLAELLYKRHIFLRKRHGFFINKSYNEILG